MPICFGFKGALFLSSHEKEALAQLQTTLQDGVTKIAESDLGDL